MSEIKVYSTSMCPWCKRLKEYLNQKGIEFTDVNVAEDVEEREEMMKKSGQMGVPQIEINGKIIVGFDQASIDAEINKNER